MSDNTMITVYPFDGALYTYYESPFMHKIDPQSLATLGKVDMGRMGLVSQAAHPHWDREGNMFTLGLRLSMTGPQYTITKFKKGEGGRSLPKRGVKVGDIPCTNSFSPSYMHSFAITDHWMVVVEQPLVVSRRRIPSNSGLQTGERGGNDSCFGDSQTRFFRSQMESCRPCSLPSAQPVGLFILETNVYLMHIFGLKPNFFLQIC